MRIYGKKYALETLSDFRTSGRFPHAIMFLGDKGIGKRKLADYTAMMYLCTNMQGTHPCMQCHECRRIEQHIHPDVLYPRPLIDEIKSKKKDKSKPEILREILSEYYKKPNDGAIRVIIFDEFDELSVQLQNVFLKETEEPLAFNKYVFTAAKKSAVINTILSRVSEIECRGITFEEFSDAMRENNIPEEKFTELFSVSAGNIGYALEAASDNDSELFDAAKQICGALADSDELTCFTGFSSVKTRDELFSLLGILSDIFANAAGKRVDPEKFSTFPEETEKIASSFRLAALTALYDESCRLFALSSANPNVQLFGAKCCSALFEAIEKNK